MGKSLKSVLKITFILIVIFSSFRLSSQQTNDRYFKGRIFVKFISGMSFDPAFDSGKRNNYSEAAFPFLKSMGVTMIEKSFNSRNQLFSNVYTVSYGENTSAEDLINEFRKSNYVVYAEQVPVERIFYTLPQDYDHEVQYNLENIDATGAWNLVTNPHKVTVAIIDDAVNINHEELRYNIWVNQHELEFLSQQVYNAVDVNSDNEITSGEIYEYIVTLGSDNNGDGIINLSDALYSGSPFINGLDDEGDGYIDDIMGWDAANNDNDPTPNVLDNYSFTHGTHVSGIAGAGTANGTGIASIGYNVRILPVKTSVEGDGYIDAGEGGMVYVSDVNATCGKVSVINMSWGGNYYTSTTFQNSADVLHSQGTVLVAAAGNDAYTSYNYPASNKYVISVGATDEQNEVCSFSTYNDSVDVMAPGMEITSLLAGTNSSYGKLSGTSMSSPLVAGLCALIFQYDSTLTPEEVEACLKSGCETNFSWFTNPSSQYYTLTGAGKINAYRSMLCIAGGSAVAANFSTTLSSQCLSVYFTDLSQNANYWKWDFGNDGITDAVIQNPSFAFPSFGNYDVKLEVSSDNINWVSIIKTVELSEPSVKIVMKSAYSSCLEFPSHIYLSFKGSSPWTFKWYDNNQYMATLITSDSLYDLPVYNTMPGSKKVKVEMVGDNICTSILRDSTEFFVEDCPNCSKEFNNWVYGQFNGTSFNTGIPEPLSSSIQCWEGSSSISNMNGTLLMYSDGETIWNRNNQVMQNGLLGFNTGSITNTSMIVKKPGSQYIYYVFSLTMDFHLFYSTVDLSLNSGLGAVIAGPVALYDSDLLDEKMGLAKHSNGTDIWLLVHGNSNSSAQQSCTFYAFQISSSGISGPVPTLTSYFDNQHGGMKFSRDGSLVAWYLQDYALIYRFNRSTGTLYDPIRINGANLQTDDYTAFGLFAYSFEFSPDNSKLYISGFMNWAKTIQYDLTSWDQSVINSTKRVVYKEGSAAIQIGPDMMIYTSTGFVIPNPNELFPSCGYLKKGIPSTGLSITAPVMHEECSIFTSGEDKELNIFNVFVYPDPSSELINLIIDKNDGPGTIIIYNALGEEVKQSKIFGRTTEINIGELSQGLYIMSVYTGSGKYFTRFLKE